MRGHHGVETRVPFVGRDRELDRLAAVLDGGGYAVLVGPGGVGKSRLALEAIRRWEDRNQREAVFVRLAGVAEEAIAGTIAEALDVRPNHGATIADALAAPLPYSPGAIVLDNCEDAPAAVRDAIVQLRQQNGTAILATSRTPLQSAGEDAIDVSPFDEGDGSAFFAARARIANVAVDLDGRDAEPVRTIVQRCDGLAVAIDLAAARLATLSVDALERELANPRPYHFRSSTGGVPRHRTLNRLVDWSLSKLDEPAQLAFALAGRFANVFDASDVAALVPNAPRAAGVLLDELAEQSLLVRDVQAGTFSMLAPIRAVAKRRLERLLDRKRLEERFAAQMTGCAARVMARLEAERAAEFMGSVAQRYDDFTSALAWALADPEPRLAAALDVFYMLGWFWTDGGRFDEGMRWCDRVLAVCGGLDPMLRGRVQYLALRVAYVACDYDRMLALGPALVTTFSVGGDRLGLARAYNGLAVALLFTGRFAEAKTYADTALALYRAIKHDAGIATTLINQGSIAIEGDENPVAARERFAEALEIATRLGRDATIAVAYGNLAETAYAVHDPEACETYAQEALAALERVGDRPRTVWPLHSLARASLMRYELTSDRAHLRRAADYLLTALSRSERFNHPDYLALCMESSARVLSLTHNYADAALIAAAAQRLRRERRVPAFGQTLAEARAELARIELELTLETRREAYERAAQMPLNDFPSYARARIEATFPQTT